MSYLQMHDHDHFEQEYWGDCTNTFDEDQKHYVYAHYMGLTPQGYSFDVNNKRILDIGGGPASIMLKCLNLKQGLVIDPLAYPAWTKQRYAVKNIAVLVQPGESCTEQGWDEVWIYNCLQHTQDPAEIIRRARLAAPVLRIFEWIDVPPHPGHPHELTEDKLNLWCAGKGGTVHLNEQGCHGRAWYGVFK
jgi:hypothetical protein